MYINCGAPHCTNVLVITTQNGYRRKGGIDGPMDSATALNVISLGVHAARLKLDCDPSELVEALDYVFELAEAALIEMRTLIFELGPESLETEGLVTAQIQTFSVDALSQK